VIRLALVLLGLLAACAVGLVTSQHHARKLFAELEREQARTKALEVEYGQLQLEQSTWAMHARVERLARQRLRMDAPEPSRLQVLETPHAPELAAR